MCVKLPSTFLLLQLTGGRVITCLYSPAKGFEYQRKVKVIRETENGTYEGRTESHEQLFFFCMRTGNSRRRRVRW